MAGKAETPTIRSTADRRLQTEWPSKLFSLSLIIFVADYIAFYKTPPTYTATCDFNNDGQINFGDLTLFVHYYIYYWSS